MKFRTVLICLVALLILTLNVQAKTPVTWDPRGIEQTLGLGGDVDLTATFVSKVTLNNVDLWIVPELQPFVSLDQTHFAVVEADTPYQVTLQFSIPFGSETGLYDGTIHLRVGSETYPQTLKVELNVLDAAATIGPEGGVVEVTDPESPVYGTKVEVPSEALSGNIFLTISVKELEHELPEETVAAGSVVDFGMDGAIFESDITITIPYGDSDNNGILDGTYIPEDHICALVYDEDLTRWLYLKKISQDKTNNTMTFSSNHFTDYTLVGPVQTNLAVMM